MHGNHEAWVLMVCHDSPKNYSVVTFICVYPHAKFQVIPVSNVKDIRDFPIWKFAVHNHGRHSVLFEYLIYQELEEIWKKRQSVTLPLHKFF